MSRIVCVASGLSFIVGLVALTGCPTFPSMVSGGGTTPEGGGGSAPGSMIEWPSLQVDPTGEDTAGFNQVISADLDDDGLVDLITSAYESQPIQIHLQQRAPDGTISFRSLSIAGSGPIVRVSELRTADIDQDGNEDIIMSIMDNGFAPTDECASQQGSIVILFAPPDPADVFEWEEFVLTRNFQCVVLDGVPITFSTLGFDCNARCYASLDVGDVNGDGFPDIVAALNGCDDETVPMKEIQLWVNPANDEIRNNEELFDTIELDTDGDGVPDDCNADVISTWDRILLRLDIVDFTGVRLSDVDLDGDLDAVVLSPETKTFDLTWQANPLIPGGSAIVPFWGGTFDSTHPIGESDAGLTFFEIGDLDGDGLEDMLALGQNDRLLRWFRRPPDPAVQDFPWEVFNMVQYSTLTPTAIDVADLDGNGQLDVVAAADGRIRWFTPLSTSPFEPWSEQLIVDDPLIPDGSGGAGEQPFAPINSVHAVDIDGDERLDIAVTLDRTGVDNDAIIWLRNTEIEQ